MTVALVGLPDVKNFGDPIIFDSTKWLLAQKYSSVHFVELSLNINQFPSRPYSLFKIISKVFKSLYSSYRAIYLRSKFISYFKKNLKGSDSVIVVGGGLIKYKYEYFWLTLSCLIKVANQLSIPVVFNSVGVEGYSETDSKCQLLKSYLNNDIVKYISTRDDFVTLRDKYIFNSSICLAKVCDPAVWASDVYGISRKENASIIGIGIIRPHIFEDNDLEYTGTQLFEFYTSLIKYLVGKNYCVELFTNGICSDNEFARLIDVSLKEQNVNLKLSIPATSKQLVSIISFYKAIISARLHSCIIAYSLNIPAIGLVWNNKLRQFGENIGCPENFVECKDFNSLNVEHQLNKALKEGYDMSLKEKFKNSILAEIDKYKVWL